MKYASLRRVFFCMSAIGESLFKALVVPVAAIPVRTAQWVEAIGAEDDLHHARLAVGCVPTE